MALDDQNDQKWLKIYYERLKKVAKGHEGSPSWQLGANASSGLSTQDSLGVAKAIQAV
jgi:hypothetical protein